MSRSEDRIEEVTTKIREKFDEIKRIPTWVSHGESVLANEQTKCRLITEIRYLTEVINAIADNM